MTPCLTSSLYCFIFAKAVVSFIGSFLCFSSAHNRFPFFSGLLPEGENKDSICKKLKINPKNKFTLLQELAQNETIGDITVQGVE